MSDNNGYEFVSRWGDPILDDRHYVNIPGFILRNLRYFVNVGWRIHTEESGNGEISIEYEKSEEYGEIVGISATEKAFIVDVMAFKFDSTKSKGAKPSIPLLAYLADKSEQAIRNRKNSLIDKGALLVDYAPLRNEPDTYLFSEIVRQCRIWESFWEEKGMSGMFNFKERVAFANSEGGQENLRGVASRILEGGGQENLRQRIRILEAEISSTKTNVLVVQDSTGSDVDRDANTSDTDVVSGVEGKQEKQEKQKKQLVLPPTDGKSYAAPDDKELTRITKKDKRTGEQKRNEQWIVALLTCFGKGEYWNGFNKDALRRFGREIRNAKEMRDSYDLFVQTKRGKNELGEDFVDIPPDDLFNDYYGYNGNKNGWIFRRLPEGSSISSAALSRYFLEYLNSDESIVASYIRRYKRSLDSDVKDTKTEAQKLQEKSEMEYKAWLESRRGAEEN